MFATSRDTPGNGIGAAFVRLLGGTTDQRRWAARFAWYRAVRDPAPVAESTAIGALITLVHDNDPQTRALAASGLAMLLAARSLDPGVTAALEVAVDDPGIRVPEALARHLADADPRNPTAKNLLARLTEHTYKPVRTAAASIRPIRSAIAMHRRTAAERTET